MDAAAAARDSPSCLSFLSSFFYFSVLIRQRFFSFSFPSTPKSLPPPRSSTQRVILQNACCRPLPLQLEPGKLFDCGPSGVPAGAPLESTPPRDVTGRAALCPAAPHAGYLFSVIVFVSPARVVGLPAVLAVVLYGHTENRARGRIRRSPPAPFRGRRPRRPPCCTG